MSIFSNISSLILGLCAWGLSLAGLSARLSSKKVMFTSFTLCGASLVVQFFELRRLIMAGDLAAVMDVYPTMAFVAAILLLGTVLLNGLALVRSGK